MEAPSKTKTYRKVVKTIQDHVKQNSNVVIAYENWYIGITKNPEQRYSAHKYNLQVDELDYWLCQYAGSKRIARAIESKFHKEGMLDTDLEGNTTEESWFVYVYKKHPTIFHT